MHRLFFLVCLPVIAAWQGSDRALALRLGLALFVLVGAMGMILAAWMPLAVRLPHTIEILADEFTYTALLVFLLARHAPALEHSAFPPAGAKGKLGEIRG